MKSKNSPSPSEDKREQIIKNARSFFTRYGFSKTTLEDIAGHLGMKKNSLYYYFPSKEAIFEEVLNQNFNTALETLRETASKESTAAGKLKMVFAKIREMEKANSEQSVSIHAIVDIHKTIRDYYKDFNKRSVTFLSGLIKSGIKSGEFRKCDSKEVARSIINLHESIKFKEFYYSNAKFINEIDFKESEKSISILIDLIIEGLKQK